MPVLSLLYRKGVITNKLKMVMTMPKGIMGTEEYNDTKTLAELCQEFGFSVPRCSRFSERICKSCGRNLRRTHNFYNQIKSALQKEGDKEYKAKKTWKTWRKTFNLLTFCYPKHCKYHAFPKSSERHGQHVFAI